MSWIHIIIWLLVAISVAFIVLMAIFNYLANAYQLRQSANSVKRHKQALDEFRRQPPPSKRTDDHLSRDKVAEKKKQEELETGVMLYNPDLDITLSSPEQEQVQIVDVAKPVGFWSEFIMKQKMGFILARMSLSGQKNDKSYWVNLVKAQDASQSKDQKRGR